MMTIKMESQKRKAVRRQASTLSEVLVAIMILSVGIISLATLFPISILRSLQATQLTNGTILRYNAETAIEVTTDLIYDPDYDGNSVEHDGDNFLVDPIGFARSNGGNNIGGMVRYPGLEKYDPGSATYTQAQAISNALNAVTLPDSWVTVYEGVPASTNAGRTSITLDSDDVTDGVVDVTQLNSIIASSVEVRAILYSPNERSSQVRPITAAISGTTVAWTDPLPATNTSVPRMRIQTREHRYSWMLSVRRADSASGGVATVDVVVFFRRPDPPTGETGYDASFVAGGQEATISFTGDGPDLKQGGYVLDATNGRWYRIQKVTETAGGAKIQLGRPALEKGDKAVVMEGVVDVYPIGNKVP